VSGAALDHREQAEGRHQLAEQLGRTGAHVAGGEEDRLAEHQMRDRHAREGARDLGEDVDRHVSPREPAAGRLRQGHRGVEVRPGDLAEGQDERDEGRAGGERVGEQGHRHVAAGQALAHDAGADHRGEQEGGSHRLRGHPPHAVRARAVGGHDSTRARWSTWAPGAR
jgi:hypothetical protein